MSCEGYYQCICENRHLNIIDFLDQRVYADGIAITEIKCEQCNGKFIWINFVNDTNCDNQGYVKIPKDKQYLVEQTFFDKCKNQKYCKDCMNWIESKCICNIDKRFASNNKFCCQNFNGLKYE